MPHFQTVCHPTPSAVFINGLGGSGDTLAVLGEFAFNVGQI